MKILKVKKTKTPFKMKNGGTIYSVYADIKKDGKTFNAEVRTYTEKIELKDGAEFNESNTSNIKQETKTFNDQEGNEKSYQQITLYAPKSEFKKGGFAPRVTYTLEEFDMLWAHAIKIAKTDSLIDVYFRCATVSGIKVQSESKTAEKVKEVFLDADPIPDEEDVVF